MDTSNNISSKIFSAVYALLALFSTLLMLQLIITNQAFVDFRGGILFTAAAVTFLVTFTASWIKWNDNVSYKYEGHYITNPIFLIFKAIFGSYAISVALFIVSVIIGGYIFEFRFMDAVIEKYSGAILLLSTVLFFPFVRKYMK